MSSSSSSSSSWSRSKCLDSEFMFGQREVKRILILFLCLSASCLVLYKAAYPLQRLSVNNLSSLVASPSSPPLPNINSSEISQETAFERCSQLHTNCYQTETSETDFSGEKVYNTPDYLKMMWRRIELLTQVLEMGFNFIFTDADIMWLRDPFPRLYPDGDFQMACDRFFGDPFDSNNWVNGGFTYVRSNNRSVEFYKFWHKSRLDYPELHDQDVFNRIKHKPFITEIGIQMRFFDTVYFGGFCQTSRDINLVCTMHANCCIGLEKKLHDLNLVLDDWRKYLSLSEHVQNTTWSAPMKCLED
ncbi:Nucleotide-diphospho-sugar transferase family protein [Raphanus sativus]|nr:Nucleotide-diphospho-sugar transferase family protein [Raphanus sativus]